MDNDDDNELIRPYRTLRHDGRIREFFRYNIPSDLYDGDDHYEQKMIDYAIYAIRECANTFRIPCNWYFLRWDGEDAIVLREANLTQEELKQHA